MRSCNRPRHKWEDNIKMDLREKARIAQWYSDGLQAG